LGYFLVFLSYLSIGTLGYVGFMGTNFTEYFQSTDGGIIDQNCLKMYGYLDISAFILRLTIFFLIFSGYPLLHFFTYQILLNLFYGRQQPELGEESQ